MAESDSSSASGIYGALNTSNESTPSPAASSAVAVEEEEIIVEEDEIIEEEYIEDEVIEEEIVMDDDEEEIHVQPALHPIEEGRENAEKNVDEEAEAPPPPPVALSDSEGSSSKASLSGSSLSNSGSGSDDDEDDIAPSGPPPPAPSGNDDEDEDNLGPPPPPPPGWDVAESSSESISSYDDSDSTSSSGSASTSSSDSLPLPRRRGGGNRAALYVAMKEVDDVPVDNLSTSVGMSPSIQAMLDAAAGAANISVGDEQLQPGAAAAAKAAAENAPTAKALTLMERKKQLMQRKKALLGIESDPATEATGKALSRHEDDKDDRKSRKPGSKYGSRKKAPKLMVQTGRGFLNKKMAAQEHGRDSAQGGSSLIANFLTQTFENFTEEQKEKELRRQAAIKRKLKRLKRKKQERKERDKRRLEKLREKKKICQDGDFTEWYKMKMRKKKSKERDRKKAIKIVTSKYESDSDDYGDGPDAKQAQGDGASRVSAVTGDQKRIDPNEFEYQYELVYSNDEYSFSSEPSYSDDYSDAYSFVSRGKEEEEKKEGDGNGSGGEYTYSDDYTDSSDDYSDRNDYRKKLELQKRTLGPFRGRRKQRKIPGKVLDRYIDSLSRRPPKSKKEAKKRKQKKKEESLVISLV